MGFFKIPETPGICLISQRKENLCHIRIRHNQGTPLLTLTSLLPERGATWLVQRSQQENGSGERVFTQNFPTCHQ